MGKTRHHLKPVSRNGSNHHTNIKMVDDKKHRAYHILFGNALPEEAVMILIKEWFYKNKDQRNKALYKLTMQLAKLTNEYVTEQKIKGFKAGAGV